MKKKKKENNDKESIEKEMIAAIEYAQIHLLYCEEEKFLKPASPKDHSCVDLGNKANQI